MDTLAKIDAVREHVTHELSTAVSSLIEAQLSLLMGVRPVVRYEELTETHGREFVELLRCIERAESAACNAQNMLASYDDGREVPPIILPDTHCKRCGERKNGNHACPDAFGGR